jgi:hypothetical protein
MINSSKIFQITSLISFVAILVLLSLEIKQYKRFKKISAKFDSYIIQQTHVTQDPQLTQNDNCTPISRPDFINLLDRNANILEVGPYYTPVLKGTNVKYFDVLDKKGLLEKATIDKLDPSNIPNIDYVESTGDMQIIKEKFNVVFSSHNIEHQVDLIRHLNQVADVLNNGGQFFLFIPDKRYCFDHFIPETPLSEVIAIHELAPQVHSLQTVIAMECETTHNDSARHWKGDHIDTQKDMSCYKRAIEKFTASNGNYIDCHKWRFTPQSFEMIVNSLYDMGLIKLKVRKVYCTPLNSHEFCAILYKP